MSSSPFSPVVGAGSAPAPIERTVILLISAVQFINILEFMMVMPLGPDFARALDIPTSHLGYIGGSYTAAAAISGLIASLFIERFDRRKALACAMLGLVCATLAAGAAVDLPTLLAARVLAGIFGGPASALSLAIIADTIPPERRGKAMGVVMGSFSLASILGVPAGLELARIGGWRLPFFAVAGLGVLIAGFALLKLPPMRSHLNLPPSSIARATFGGMLTRPIVSLSLLTACVLMVSVFMLVPNIAAYVQGNLGYPRDRMSLLYLVGGGCSFLTMRFVGRLVDRYGSFAIGTFGTALVVVTIYTGFVNPQTAVFVMPIFAAFMVSTSFRNVPFQTLTSQVPRPDERARYMSVQSSVQHMSAAVGAFLASRLLTEGEGGALVGVETIAWISIALSLTIPVLLFTVQRRVKRQKVAPAVVQEPVMA